MTSSPTESRRLTSLLEELRKEIPPLFVQGLGLHANPLGKEVERLTHQYGAAAPDPKPPADIFMRVKGALLRGVHGLADLSPSLLRHVPHVLLYDRSGRQDGALIQDYLARLGKGGDFATRRLWTHYLLSFEHDDLATNEIAAWLKLRIGALPERVLGFTQKYEVLEPARTSVRMAVEVLNGDDFARDLAAIGFTLERLQTSALLVAILGSIGKLLRDGANPLNPVGSVNDLLGGNVGNAFQQAQAREDLRRRALAAFIEGFVAWQRRVDPENTKFGPVLDMVVTVNLDPRFSPGRWNNIVARATTDVVEEWLTKHTIEAFFRVVNRLRTDLPHMWAARRPFWMAYLPFVRRAWLIVGDQGRAYAKQEKIRFGEFGGGVRGDHCGLLLDFDDLRVLEMNVLGRAIFWKPSEVEPGVFPEVYDEATYDRGDLSTLVPRKEIWSRGRIGLAHQPSWQWKFANCIQQHTRRGIRPRGF
jgi:hypothetical protein